MDYTQLFIKFALGILTLIIQINVFGKSNLAPTTMACMSRDFGIFMPKHLAAQWLLNSYLHTISTGTSSIFATLRMVSICLPTAAAM